MAPAAGYSSSVSLPGTSTALTNEAMTALTAGLIYQITAAAHQALDPAVAVVVQVSTDGGVTWVAPTGTYAIDYAAGVVTFAASQGGSAQCRISSGNYIPLLAVNSARKFAVSMKLDDADVTVFGNTAHARQGELDSADVTLEQFDSFHADYNTGAYTGLHRLYDDLYASGAKLFVFIQPGGSGQAFRGWCIITGLDEMVEVADVVKGTVTLKSTNNVPASPGANEVGSRANFSWR